MKTLRAFASLVLCLGPALASAGMFTGVIVNIDRSHSMASGSITGARINTGQEYIRCHVSIQGAARGFASSGTCGARDVHGATALCRTSEPNLLQAIMSINTMSEVRFGWDASNVCTFITIVYSSSNVE